MSPGALITSLRGRGIAVEVTAKGRLRVRPASALTPEERTYLREHSATVARTVAAMDRLATLRRSKAEDNERELAQAARDAQEQAKARHRREWVEHLASLDEGQLEERVSEGALTAEDVADVVMAREAMEQRIYRATMALMVGALMGGQVYFE
jgi:hypothetical protein